MTHDGFSDPDFKVLFESGPGLYLVLNAELRIVAASNAYLEATLTRRDEIVGRHIFDVFPDRPDEPAPDAVRNARASFQRVLQTRKPDTQGLQRHDVRRPESEGGGFEERYWIATNTPILHADGSLAYILHRVENATEFVKVKQQGMEQEKVSETLREQAVRMESDLYARSREVAETSEKLKSANEELERLYEKTRELDVLKSQFFVNVSHELRTPLTLILGPVDRLLEGGLLDPDAQRALTVVQRNARLLAHHVNNLLDLSKLEAGRMPVQYVRTDLAALARVAASHFETLAADLDIAYAVETPPAVPAEVDGEKVQRVVLNLLSNAFKFTPHGGAIRLEVAAEQAKSVARISVQDNGPGVPQDLRQAIFERFRQGDGAADRQHGGTGLGLAIVREFASLHGGSADVTEAPGGGALFSVVLPLQAPAGASVAHESARAADGTAGLTFAGLEQAPLPTPVEATTAERDRPRILVVEDNPDMNRFLSDALGRHYWVTRAFDGLEGLTKALADPPDLIVSDVMMPRMTGVQMVQELRRHDLLDDVPIVMLTAKADDARRVDLLRHGVQDYIYKPFTMEEFLARVEGLLAERCRTAQRLRQSEERYRTLFNTIDQGFCIVEMKIEPDEPLDYRFIEVNAAFEKQSTLANATGKWIRELRPDIEDFWFETYRGVATTGNPVRFEQQARPLDGRWFEVYAFGAGTPEQKRVGILFTDVTERKRAEEALRESEERFRTLADNIAQLAWMAHGDGRVFWRNRRWYEFTDVGVEDSMPWDWEELIHPDHSAAVKASMRRSFDTGEVWADTFPLRGSDGTYRWFLCRANAIRDGAGVVVRWFGTFTDITEQKKIENALRRSNADLQQFAYIASHDLREPLRNVANYAELLSRTYTDERFRSHRDRCIGVIVNASKRMDSLITAILTYARATGSGEGSQERVDLNEIAAEAMTNLQSAIAESSARVTHDRLPTVRANRVQMLQVFQNLLANSLKYRRPDTPPRVHMSVHRRHDEWVFCVQDNGEGFSREYAEKVFGIFKRLHGAEIPGTGIGLAICKAIIDRHGGQIWAVGHPGEGAEFCFTLPQALSGR